jgi:hypothetical protein
MPPQAGAKPLYVIGTGAVRVEIVEDVYGYPEFRVIRHRYSIIGNETTPCDRFDPALIGELICRLEQTRNFFRQRSADARASAASNREGQRNGK